MQDLSVVGPFFLVGLAMVAVALIFARQTAVSARKLDALMAESRDASSISNRRNRIASHVRPIASTRGNVAQNPQEVPSVENIPN
jgi:hypothetical protein